MKENESVGLSDSGVDNRPGEENGNWSAQSKPVRSLEEIDEAHIRHVDKFFRMYTGTASSLIGFHAGFIYLKIRIDDRLSFPLETIVRNIAKSWRREQELSGATGYSALVYKSARRSGFVLEPDATARQTEEAIKRMKEPDNEPDVFVKIVEEEYDSSDAIRVP